MKVKHYITLSLSLVIPVAPQLVTAVPAPYRDAATALLSLLAALYHLMQEPPSTVP